MLAWRVFRASDRDALVLGASVAHGALLAMGVTLAVAAAPSPAARVGLAALLGVAMNWGSNTVSHIHLHAPLFRDDRANRAYGLYLSVLLGVPQSWWKLFHLAHHGLLDGPDAPARRRLEREGFAELAALLALVVPLAALAPLAFATVYAPAMLLGFLLCAIQGRQEHARSDAGVDVHAPLYNRLWFNDGFHAAHHRAPAAHWTTLPSRASRDDVVSALPPTVRWLEAVPALANAALARVIDVLERATLGLAPVRRFLLATHARAWRRVLATVDAGAIREVTIVGGGLFPRTALVLAALLPRAHLTILDAAPAHLARARRFLDEAGVTARFVEGTFDAGHAATAGDADLLVVPLAFRGDRARLYAAPPARLVAVHDWLWRPRGRGARVSLLLLKRLNLVQRDGTP
jgi:hypothetical protein